MVQAQSAHAAQAKDAAQANDVAVVTGAEVPAPARIAEQGEGACTSAACGPYRGGIRIEQRSTAARAATTRYTTTAVEEHRGS